MHATIVLRQYTHNSGVYIRMRENFYTFSYLMLTKLLHLYMCATVHLFCTPLTRACQDFYNPTVPPQVKFSEQLVNLVPDLQLVCRDCSIRVAAGYLQHNCLGLVNVP